MPKRFHQLAKKDLASCDLLILLGASLQVITPDTHTPITLTTLITVITLMTQGPLFQAMVNWVPPDTPRLVLNWFSLCDPTPTMAQLAQLSPHQATSSEQLTSSCSPPKQP